MGKEDNSRDDAVRFGEAQRAQGALQRALHDELVLENLTLAEEVAASYKSPDRDIADLRQVA